MYENNSGIPITFNKWTSVVIRIESKLAIYNFNAEWAGFTGSAFTKDIDFEDKLNYWIGRNSDGNSYFNGYIDDFKIHNNFI